MKQNFTRFFSLLTLLSFGLYAQAQIALDIPDSPESYIGGDGVFYIGCFDTPISGELVRAMDDTATGDTLSSEICNPITTDVNGKIAVVDRGSCSFKTKVLNAQNAGAIGIVICNSEPESSEDGGTFRMADDDSILDEITIPSVLLSLEDCQDFEIALPITGTLRPASTGPRVIWGDQAGQGDFNGGLNDWTTNTVSCNGAESDAEVWIWNADAIANRGSFGAGAQPVASPTACNGAMVFDSDFLDNEGLAQSGDASDPAFGSGPCPSIQIAELISPTIDLSSSDVTTISLSFYQNAREFDSQYFVGYSIDGGTTWTDIEINTEIGGNSLIDAEDVFQVISMPELAGQSNVKVRFRMVGNYYYWIIDDVKIVEGFSNELEVVDVFYTPASARQPASQVVFDPFYFAADITNNGTAEQTNVQLFAEVWKLTDDLALEELIFIDSSLYEVIPVGVDTTLEIVDLWTPTIGPGIYAIIYTVLQEETDQVILNNDDNYIFEITETTYAKDLFTSDEQIAGLGRLSRDFGDESLTHAYACAYSIGADTREEFFLDNISWSSALPEAEGVLDGNSVEVYLAEVSESVDADYDNFNFTSTDFSADGQLTIIGEQEFDFPDGSGQGGILFSTNLNNNTDEAITGEEPISLVPGTRYFAMTRYTGASSYLYQVYAIDITYRFLSGLLFLDRWYSGYAGNGFAPIIRMELSMTVAAEDTPLPDNTMNVFPNPATSVVQAQFDFEANTDATVTLATIEGKVIEYRNLSLLNQTISFNTSNLAAGMYLMRVRTDEGSKTVKFLVQQP